MNRKRLKELMPVMQAFLDGKKIQYLNYASKWVDVVGDPVWGKNDTYRVKPEVVNVKQWAIFNSSNQLVVCKTSEDMVDRDIAYYRLRNPTADYYKVELTGSYER